jgi:hypothetical protein
VAKNQDVDALNNALFRAPLTSMFKDAHNHSVRTCSSALGALNALATNVAEIVY